MNLSAHLILFNKALSKTVGTVKKNGFNPSSSSEDRVPLDIILATLLFVCSYIMLLGACESYPITPNPNISSGPSSTSFISLEDSHGHHLTIRKPITSFVSFSPAFTEIVFAIEAEQIIVGRDDFSNFPQEALNVPIVGDAFTINLEKLVELEPDLVYLSFDRYKPAIEQLGIPVLFLEPPQTVEGVIENIHLAGNIFDKQKQSANLALKIQEDIRLLEAQIQLISTPLTIYFELDPGLWSAGPNTFIGDILKRLNTQNIVRDNDGDFPQFSNETIIERNPDIVILAHSPEIVDQIYLSHLVSSRPGWSTVSAVKNNRIYSVSSDLISRPGPRIQNGMREMAQIIYPDITQ